MTSKQGGNSVPKPLKGNSVNAASGTFDVLTANSLVLNSVTIDGLISGATLDQVTISNATIINSIIGQQGPNIGSFTDLSTSQYVTFQNYNDTKSVTWNPNTSTFTINGEFIVDGCATIGNIGICQNTIQAVDGNDINILPQDLGTIYLSGPITNISSTGNLLSFLQNGNIQLIANDFVNLRSNNGPINLSSLGPQTFSTLNGNINLDTQTGLITQFINKIINTGGNLQITTVSASNLQSGDIINITGSNSFPTINGSYVVTNILSPNVFNISTGTNFGGIISSGNTGTFLQTPNNSINLNASTYVNIPCDIPLTFCNTENTISGNSNGLLITSHGDLTFNVPYNSLIANSSGQFNTSDSYSIIIPQYTALQFGSNGNTNVNFDGSNFNINNIDTNGNLTKININSDDLYLNATDTFIYDPNPSISQYTTYDQSDRGIQFNYFNVTTLTNGQNITTGPLTGWFGFKNSTNKFTFLTDTILTDSGGSEIITGTIGKFDIGDISVTNITINSGGTMDIACGDIINVREIKGCTGDININAGTNINITASNQVSFNTGQVYIPQNVNIAFGSSGNIIKTNTNGNLLVNSFRNINLTTFSNGAVILPIATRLTFDGTSAGNSDSIVSNSAGDLTLTSKTNLYLKAINNVVVPSNVPILFGNNTIPNQTITGNTSGLFITNKVESLNIISNTNVNIISSVGNLLLVSLNGDTQLFNSNGNVRILPNESLIFNVSGTSNSILTDPFGNFIFNGANNTSNSIQFNNSETINLNANAQVNIPTSVALNLSTDLQRYIITDTNGNLLINNKIPNTSTIINVTNTLINNSGGTLTLTNNTTNITSLSTNISSTSFILSGTSPYTVLSTPTSGSYSLFNVQNVKFEDPILSLANYQILNSAGNAISDNRDRGIEYNYYNVSSGSMALGWFGWKNSTGQFSFYSQAINNNEVISGTLGTLALGNAVVYQSISFVSRGSIDLSCGTISNVNTITGCQGTVNIFATNTINANASNINLNGNVVTLPYSTPLSFGSQLNSISTNTSGIMTITANGGVGTIVLNGNLQIFGSTNTVFSTVTSYQDPILVIGGVTGPVTNDNLDRGILFNWNNGVGPQQGFFGYSNATQAFEFIQNATETNGIISGSLGNVQFGNGSFNNLNVNCGTISNVSLLTGCASTGLNISSIGLNISNTGFITISSSNTIFSPNSSLNFTNTNVSLSSTNGNLNINSINAINITSQTNGIFLNTNSSGSGFIQITRNSSLLFGSTNISISSDTSGNLKLLSTSGNIFITPNISNGNVFLPQNINLVFGNNNSISGNTSSLNVFGPTNGTLNFNANSISISSLNTSLINTSGTLFINNNVTNITTASFIITGNTSSYTLLNTPTSGSYMLLDVQNVKTTDPILSLANYSLTTNDLLDRGIEYNYFSSGSMALGYFGWKNSTNQFVFYSKAINNGETITGTLGTFALGSAVISNSLSFVSRGNIDLSCGTISNVNTITGCQGTVNILATNSINASASNIFLNASNNIQIPYQIPLSFGDTNSFIRSDGSGNLTITSKSGNGSLTLNANLQIFGSTTTVYSTVTSYQNPLLIIGGVTGPVLNDHLDRGIVFNWNNDTTTQQGFFGFSSATQTFEFIPSASIVNGVISGSLGNVQFGNGSFNNLNVNCGTISNVSLLTACPGTGLNISSTSLPINISTGSIVLNPTTKLFWGNSSNSISISNGSLITNAINTNNININCGTISNVSVITACPGNGLSLISFLPINMSSSSVLLNQNTQLIWDTASSIFISNGNLNLNSNIIDFNSDLNINGDTNINCNTLSNVNTITGCNGTVLNILSNTINASTNNLALPANSILSFAGSQNSISCNSSGILTITANNGNGTIVFNSNIQIFGSTNTVYSTVTSYVDPIIVIGGVTSGSVASSLMDRGILFYWNNGSISEQGFFGYSSAAQAFEFIQYATETNGVISGSLGNVQFGNSSFNNLNVNCGTISNVSVLTACNNTGLNIIGGTTNSILISTNNLVLPPNSYVDFGTSNSSVSGDGSNLFLNGYTINVNSSTVNISGNVNINGILTANNISGGGGGSSNSVDYYIYPVGEQQTQNITSIINSSTIGSILITTNLPNYLTIGDQVSITLTDSVPVIDGVYTVTSVIDNSTFVVNHSTLTGSGTTGQMTSVWTTDPGKDVGIQFNYWNTAGNSNVTDGSVNYRTAFLGYLHSNQTLTYYSQAIIQNQNQILSGTLGNVQVGGLITNLINLNGPLVGNSSASINNVPIGQSVPQPASFTTLTNSSSASLSSVSLSYSVDRFTCSPLLANISPNLTSAVSFVSVFTNNFYTASGTLGNSGVQDGQIKKIIMSNIGSGSIYTLFIGNLVAPSQNCTPQRLTFKRSGQNAELVYDAVAGNWILAGGNAYVSA
jgi:hypothetical protein